MLIGMNSIIWLLLEIEIYKLFQIVAFYSYRQAHASVWEINFFDDCSHHQVHEYIKAKKYIIGAILGGILTSSGFVPRPG